MILGRRSEVVRADVPVADVVAPQNRDVWFSSQPSLVLSPVRLSSILRARTVFNTKDAGPVVLEIPPAGGNGLWASKKQDANYVRSGIMLLRGRAATVPYRLMRFIGRDEGSSAGRSPRMHSIRCHTPPSLC